MWKQFAQDTSRRHSKNDTADTDGSQPLWTQFQKRTSRSGSGNNASASSPATESQPQPSPRASQSTASPSPESGDDLSTLERAVFGSSNPPKRDLYVQKLFQGDREDYRSVLNRLREIESWSTASQIIASDVFRAHQVNIYSDAAVHFTNAVEAGFKE
jgi:hypothetical protein